jgi:predicted ribosome quality control (RQC) complex YloA/Tae2 family protein
MQRGLSAFDLMVIVHELQDLLGSYIENIYQYSRDEILIKINNKKTDQKETIFIRNGEFLCITPQKFDVPEKPSVFAMTLRKYLLNGKITKITQHEFDRIIFLTIGRKEGDYTMVFELIPKGNVILLNPEGVILVPLFGQQWAHRTIKTHEKYVPPPTQTNPYQLSYESFSSLLTQSSKDLVRFFAMNLNFGGVYAEEFLIRAGIDKNTKPQDLPEEKRKKLYDDLQQFLHIFSEKKFEPTCILEEGKTIDVLPVSFISYQNTTTSKCDSFTRSLEASISQRKIKEKTESKHEQKRDSLQRQLLQQQESIQDFKKKIIEKQKEGELIYQHQQVCSKLLADATELLRQKDKTHDLERLKEHPQIIHVNLAEHTLTVRLVDNENKSYDVLLDVRKNVSDNAQQAYTTSKKIQEKLKGAEDAIEKTRYELKNIELHIEQEEAAPLKKEKRLEKEFWFERFRWFITSEGNLVVGGKDAKSNDLVVKKHLSDGDRYIHADIHGAPSCIVKNKNITDMLLSISEKSLEEACIFGASFSKAWNQFAEAQAYWVLPEQVSKTPQSGEYVPKGGFIIRGKRNYYRCKLELAVGKIVLDGVEKIMCGPVSALQTHTDTYLVLVPGVMKKTVAAQKIAKLLSVGVSAIEQILPPGNIQIIRGVGINLEAGGKP